MRTIRIYQAGQYQVGDIITLLPQASMHVSVVLRMQLGDDVTLFNGANQECQASLVFINKKSVRVRIETSQLMSRESPLVVHLAPGIIKGEGMEWLIQKAVELGVNSISPLLTQHSAVKQDPGRLAKKHLQWQAIAISACEQSGRNTLPCIHAPVSLSDYLQQQRRGVPCVLEPNATHAWRTLLQSPSHQDASEWHVLVGPEGGWHANEIEQMLHANFQSFHLGPRILRAETASVAALSVLQVMRGDL